jgi:hypothetical protein
MGRDAVQHSRAVRKGPPITLTCECGEKRELRYGERWQCEKCSRTWDTNQIPVEQYAAIRARQHRQAVLPLTVLLLVAAAVAFFIAEHRAVGAVLLVPMVGFIWAQFVRPLRQRRYRAELAELPQWEIKPE